MFIPWSEVLMHFVFFFVNFLMEETTRMLLMLAAEIIADLLCLLHKKCW